MGQPCLVANMLILNNVHRMSKVLSDLQHGGKFVIDAKLAAALSPYRTDPPQPISLYTSRNPISGSSS